MTLKVKKANKKKQQNLNDKTCLVLEANLKLLDYDLYCIYLSNPKLHNNKLVLEALNFAAEYFCWL